MIIKSQWSVEEDWILFLSRRIFQNRLNNISPALFSRTDNDCKNHWNTVLKHKAVAMEELFLKYYRVVESNRKKHNSPKSQDSQFIQSSNFF